ncbi:DNA polymerase beta domain protein region [Ferroglobus placidus DSM 10642]|uniref:DNA polymerase beta domain protein region n=1 Tax=Ferroglobus placidus (strain DSM 10642 / AEDII12DO) TaxID=589924 RepID=D3RWP9_FERPA|nr:nucleotidyltransferase domain-containing protein [Ferroglobus placidus]ADC64912.1 DNA polymerase beta domain protein region [Ferroglobus placidus DSM 10642]
MDIVKKLLEEREKRRKIFENYICYAEEIKKIAKKYFGDARIYVFGSVVEKRYHVMLSDIDIAVVTSNFDKERALKLKVEIEKKFGEIFQIHVLSEREWKFYLNFVKKFVEV